MVVILLSFLYFIINIEHWLTFSFILFWVRVLWLEKSMSPFHDQSRFVQQRLHHLIPLKPRSLHCVKSARIWSFSGPYSVQMRKNTEQKTPNRDTFHAVPVAYLGLCQNQCWNVFETLTYCRHVFHFIYPLKATEKQTFSVVFRRYSNGTLEWNGLTD